MAIVASPMTYTDQRFDAAVIKAIQWFASSPPDFRVGKV
jgi:hypothetical protein